MYQNDVYLLAFPYFFRTFANEYQKQTISN